MMKYLLILSIFSLTACNTYKGTVLYKEYSQNTTSCNSLIKLNKSRQVDVFTFSDRIWLVTDCAANNVGEKVKFKTRK